MEWFIPNHRGKLSLDPRADLFAFTEVEIFTIVPIHVQSTAETHFKRVILTCWKNLKHVYVWYSITRTLYLVGGRMAESLYTHGPTISLPFTRVEIFIFAPTQIKHTVVYISYYRSTESHHSLPAWITMWSLSAVQCSKQIIILVKAPDDESYWELIDDDYGICFHIVGVKVFSYPVLWRFTCFTRYGLLAPGTLTVRLLYPLLHPMKATLKQLHNDN